MRNTMKRPDARRPGPAWIRRTALSVYVLFLLHVLAAGAQAAVNSVSFTWKANPPDENVVGYRLYYGSVSRFLVNGVEKVNIPYTYYIDFTEEMRCEADGGATNCEPLGSGDIQCINLFGDTPTCTVFNMRDRTYVAMTAYNAQEESDFTEELVVRLINARARAAAAVGAINHLLLNKE